MGALPHVPSSIATILHGTALILLLHRVVTNITPRFRPPLSGAAHLLRGALHDASRVRIYVYTLPPKYNRYQVLRSHSNPAPIRDPYCDTNFYSAEVKLHHGLLRSRARTTDWRQADYFYVPIYVTCFLINNHPNNLTRTGTFFREAMEYVIKKYPYFNSSQGRDHILTFTQGFGARLAGHDWQRWRNCIFLTHNGDYYGEEYTVRKDIVIPPNLGSYLTPVYIDPKRRDSLVLERRRHMAQFGGQSFSVSIKDHRGSNYSGGVRQYLASALSAQHGFHITGVRSDSYLNDMRDSMFCLAPEGWHPWSPRPYYGILLGCVPVVLSERQELAFEDVVPYDSFVLWIKPDNINELNDVLRAISVEDILGRIRNMESMWTLFWYDPPHGNAMHAILAELSRHKYLTHPHRIYHTRANRPSLTL